MEDTVMKVLIVHEEEETRAALKELLSGDEGILVAGEAPDVEEAARKIRQLMPDLVLLDIDGPGRDGMEVAEDMAARFPELPVIIAGSEDSPELMRRALLAGAKDYLLKPLHPPELAGAVRNTCMKERQRLESIESHARDRKRQGKRKRQVITVFSSKGGAGKTTLAVNLALQLARDKNRRVLLLDLDLQFGDVAVLLDIVPRRSIAELVQEKEKLNLELIHNYLIDHKGGVQYLPAPIRPEDAELLTEAHVEQLLQILRPEYDYIVIDTPAYFHDAALVALDLSTQIILITPLEMHALKDLKVSMQILEALHQQGRAKLVINRATEDFGITVSDVEKILNFKAAHTIPSDYRTVARSINQGQPFILEKPGSAISRSIAALARIVIDDTGYQKELLQKSGRSGFSLKKIFGRGGQA